MVMPVLTGLGASSEGALTGLGCGGGGTELAIFKLLIFLFNLFN
jgi:hypothetical protein